MNLNPASAGRVAFTRKEPIGVVVAVSAFNHPLNLIVHQVGSEQVLVGRITSACNQVGADNSPIADTRC